MIVEDLSSDEMERRWPASLPLFTSKFAGIAITPGDERYGQARALWNGAVDARPALIARCQTTDDIAAAVNLTRDSGLPLAVRGGGHSVAGLSTCDGGVVIDLSLMRTVTVSTCCIVVAEPGDVGRLRRRHRGARAGQHRRADLHHRGGRAHAWRGDRLAQRKHGLACDNLVAAEVITADGTMVRASEQENPHPPWGPARRRRKLRHLCPGSSFLRPGSPRSSAGSCFLPSTMASACSPRSVTGLPGCPTRRPCWPR